MLINLSELFTKEGKTIQYSADIEMTKFDNQGESYDILSKKPLELTIVNTGSRKLLVEGEIELTLSMPCDRCLTPVEVPFSIPVSRTLDMSLTEEERVNELDEQTYVKGYNLDVDELVCNEILLSLPMKVLCDENCKGICNRCGANLNYETCDCDTRSLDPRMSVIQEIFNNFKEV